MDIKFLFYAFLCVIAFIFVIRFGNSKSILKKEAKFYHKLLRLKLSTRILIIILAWIFSAIWIIIAYKYDYKGISILGMMPFMIVYLGVINMPIWEYLRKKILKSSYSDSINRNNNIDSPAIIRPWIQAFTATWVKGHINYGPNEIKEQIKALKDLGVEEYILWSPTNKYEKFF